MAHWSGSSDSDLLTHLGTDDGFGMVGVTGAIGTGYICVQSMTKKLLHYGDRAVVRPCDIPNVGVTLSMTLSSLPPAWKGPLSVLIDNLPIFNNHVDCAQVQLIIICDHVVKRMVRLVLQPFALASGLQNLVSRENRSLGIRPAVDHVGDVVGLVY